MKNYSPDTIRRYRSNIKLFCKLTGVENIDQVTDAAVHQFFFDGRRNREWSAVTFITYHKSLTVFFRWCVKGRYLVKNPADDVEEPTLEKKLPSKLNQEQALRVLEYIDNYRWESQFLRRRNHAIFAMFIFAGLRRRELLNLKCSEVDLTGLTITVRKGKGAKDRLVPICPPLVDLLQRYLKERSRLRKTCPEFFTSMGYDMQLTDNGFKHLMRHVVTMTKLKFSAHRLRHTFATLMLEGGCDIYSLSKMMGHSDIKTTTIYLSASDRHLKGEMLKHPLNEQMLTQAG